VTGNTRMSAKLAPAPENAVFFGFILAALTATGASVHPRQQFSSLEQVQQ
jgi:hypothetical protein